MMRETIVPAQRLAESMWIKWLRPPVEYFECRPPKAYDIDPRPAAIESAPGEWRVKLDGSSFCKSESELKVKVPSVLFAC